MTFEGGPDSLRNLDALAEALRSLQPRGKYGGMDFVRPPDHEVRRDMQFAVLDISGFGSLSDREVNRFILELEREDQVLFWEACAARGFKHSINSALENAYQQSAGNPRGTLAWDEAQAAIARYRRMCGALATFLDQSASRVKNESVRELLIEYAQAVRDMPDDVRDSSPDWRESED